MMSITIEENFSEKKDWIRRKLSETKKFEPMYSMRRHLMLSNLLEQEVPLISSNGNLERSLPPTSQTSSYVTLVKRGRKYFNTSQLFAALDGCHFSIRDSVFMLQAVVEVLGLPYDQIFHSGHLHAT